ncbi:hypothetical protein Hte_012240 [Hypoxylon texense]
MVTLTILETATTWETSNPDQFNFGTDTEHDVHYVGEYLFNFPRSIYQFDIKYKPYGTNALRKWYAANYRIISLVCFTRELPGKRYFNQLRIDHFGPISRIEQHFEHWTNQFEHCYFASKRVEHWNRKFIGDSDNRQYHSSRKLYRDDY